jgi:predicted nucleic acid-binding protein
LIRINIGNNSNEKDSWHESAKLALQKLPVGTRLVTILPCITEACFFLDLSGKNALLAWLARGSMRIRVIESADLPNIAHILTRYSDREMDFADACFVWLAGEENTNRILTTDLRDFDTYRTPGGKPFERLWLEYGS